MNKRFVWNFEINSDNSLQIPNTEGFVQSPGRWESRFFWSDDQIITLNCLNNNFLALSHYEIKHRQDTYYLLPNTDYNLKVRCEQLFYKPILMKKTYAVAYGKKINLEEHPLNMQLPCTKEKDAHTLIALIKDQGIKINVEKEALIYKFDTTPATKFELAWLRVANKNYYSASIESRSMLLVESIAKQLIGDRLASDYVSFLREISK